MNDRVDFSALAAALLQRADSLVASWLPGGTQRGHEYVCADLGGGKGDSCSVNTTTGRWADFAAEEQGGDLISLYARIHGMNNGQAARELRDQLGLAPAREGAAAPVASKRKSTWRPIVPVPAHAPAPTFKHHHYDAPVATWAYRRGDVLYGYVARFLRSEGGKEILPLTWCADDGPGHGTMRWHWKQWDEPRPLYLAAGGLRGLPIVLVEGEKCADAGHAVLGEIFDFVSWPGGSKAWQKADWTWISSASVILWPDADAKRVQLTPEEKRAGVDSASKPFLDPVKQPGMSAMIGLGSHLQAKCGCDVRICTLPSFDAVPDGWDIADALGEGWTSEQANQFIQAARPLEASEAPKAESTPPVACAGPQDPKWWRDLLLKTDKGAIKTVRENVVFAIEGSPDDGILGIEGAADVIAYNEFTNDVMKLREAPWGSPAGAWTEVDELKLGEWLVRKHFMPSMPRSALEEAVRIIAHNNRFHPVRKYLESLEWDGRSRLATWLMVACLEEDEWDIERDPRHAYLARVGTWFIQGMCARVMQPGCKFDWMLILEGEQGMRKSTLFRTLGGEYFADTGLVLGDKDSYQQLQGRWIYEFSELDSFGKADVTKIKSFVASASDYFRASFDRRARDYPRQVVFGGSTNEIHYLTDATGNRRFWPVRVEKVIDIDWVSANRDQLFAEAMVRMAKGKRMFPTTDEEKSLFVPQQQDRAVENAIEVAVGRFLYDNIDGVGVDEISLVELLGKIGIGVEKLGPGRFHEKQASAALRRMGWIEGRSSKPPRPRVWKRPATPPASAVNHGSTQSRQPEGADDGSPY
jgi:predicted P-loop ATPase